MIRKALESFLRKEKLKNRIAVKTKPRNEVERRLEQENL